MANQPNQMQVGPDQMRAAAEAGLRLLNDDEVRVPSPLALSGHLNVLVGMLQGIVQGQLIVTNPPEVLESEPDGEGPKLKAVKEKE